MAFHNEPQLSLQRKPNAMESAYFRNRSRPCVDATTGRLWLYVSDRATAILRTMATGFS